MLSSRNLPRVPSYAFTYDLKDKKTYKPLNKLNFNKVTLHSAYLRDIISSSKISLSTSTEDYIFPTFPASPMLPFPFSPIRGTTL